MDIAKLVIKARKMRAKSSYHDAATLGSARIAQNADQIRGVFVHIHKCAGTSVINRLQARPETICCVARPGDFDGRTGRELIPDEIWAQAKKFTFVRNPYARIYSAWAMFSNSWMWRLVWKDFDAFVESMYFCDVDRQFIRHEMPESEFNATLDTVIHHCSSFHNPKYHIEEMDYIGKVETLAPDMEAISTMLGVDLGAVPHLRKTSGGASYRDQYSDHARKLIADKYAADIERFEYTF